jgi:uncharacterized membrane protein YozB (DUF420 family)
MVQYLPHVNVALNSLSIVLLLMGWVFIKQKKEVLHRNAMLATFAVSTVFLISYLTYHYFAGHVEFPKTAPKLARGIYLSVLLTHILLAMTVPVFAIASIYLGLKDKRAAHRKVVRWAWPIWMYVSITGVFVYVMLYQLYRPVS